jgi:hypothetical protein
MLAPLKTFITSFLKTLYFKEKSLILDYAKKEGILCATKPESLTQKGMKREWII